MARTEDRSGWVSPDKYSYWADIGRKYTKMMLKSGPANQGIHPISTAAIAWNRVWLSSVVESNQKAQGIAEAAQVYDYALRLQTGNCTEHASVAFTYLYRLGVRPIVMLGYSKGFMQDNHMVVAVGLDISKPNFTLGDFRSDKTKDYSADLSWICDPWKNKTYRAIQDFWTNEPGAGGKLEMQAFAV